MIGYATDNACQIWVSGMFSELMGKNKGHQLFVSNFSLPLEDIESPLAVLGQWPTLRLLVLSSDCLSSIIGYVLVYILPV